MRNLYQAVLESWEACGIFTCDAECIYVLTSPLTLQVLSPSSSVLHHLEAPIESPIDLTFLQLEEKLMFVTSSSIISYSPQSKDLVNEGGMGCQILSAKWSPNQEALVLFLSNGAVFLHNADLEVISTQQTDFRTTCCIAWKADSKFFQICGQSESGLTVSTYDNKGEKFTQTVESDKKGPVISLSDNGKILTSSTISWHSALISGISNNTVILWEKNGLRHEEFKVLGSKVLKLEWNPDGKILAVVSDEGLELYVRSNYQWSLKSFVKGVVDVCWAEENLVYLKEKIWKIQVRAGAEALKSCVAVVDGVRVKVTDFSKGVLPPPMSHLEYEMKRPPRLIRFCEESVLAIGENLCEYPLGAEIFSGQVDFAEKINKVYYLAISNQLFTINSGKLDPFFTYPCAIRKLLSYSDQIYVQTKDGQLYSGTSAFCKFPAPCDELYLLPINGSSEPIGLISGALYINNALFTNGCTSLLVSNNFLFFIKKNAPYDVLYIFHSSDLPWTKSLPEPSAEHFYSRNVEKTSILLCLTGCNLILQHSRGNLEGICPRLIILHLARDLIASQKYFSVFKLLRQNKIDLNLIYDLDPERFDVSLFIKEVYKVEFLNLFLTALKDFDSVGKYFHCRSRGFEGKVNKIAGAFIEKLNPETHALCILTGFVVKVPAEIESALRWVQKLKASLPPKPVKAPHKSTTEASSIVHAEDAVKYLSWLVNPEKLYDVALSMYDLELASDLAKHTQKDPKEFLPYLTQLKQLNPVIMKYQINIDLKNYSKGLEELVNGGPEYRLQCLELIKEQKLFRQAMELMSGADVHAAMAESLVRLNHPLQAAALFEEAGELSKARDLYVQCEEWELAVKMAEALNENHNELWSSKCAELGRFESAALLLDSADTEHLQIKYWIQAGKYKKAATICRSPEGKALIKSTLKSYANDMIADLGKNLKIWTEKKARLDLVQQNKRLMPESSKVLNDETASLYSLDSSASKATQFTKKQRKKNKKIRKTAAKEGSSYEEDYLVDLLITLRPDAVYLEKAEGLCMGLIIVGEVLSAFKLWKTLEEVKTTTFQTVCTLAQSEFLRKFYENFPEIGKGEENDSKLKDMFAKSTFLAEGLGSHKLPSFTSKLQSFFKCLS